jgi:hypothetical protein
LTWETKIKEEMRVYHFLPTFNWLKVAKALSLLTWEFISLIGAFYFDRAYRIEIWEP